MSIERKDSKEVVGSFVGTGCSIVGNLQLSDNTTIGGIVEGELRSTAELVIGESADIRAQVHGVVVKVFGKVAGDIVCSERLELHGGAQVSGDIITPALIIRDGVVFEGRCNMKQAQESGTLKVANKSGPKILEFPVEISAESGLADASPSTVGDPTPAKEIGNL